MHLNSKAYSMFPIYTEISKVLCNSSVLMNELQKIVVKINTPFYWMLWGIMILVYIDVINNVIGGPLMYTHLIGKLMIEAFFYALFFGLWTEYLKSNTWKDKLIFINNSLKNPYSLRTVLKPIHIFHLYFWSVCAFISFFVPLWVTCVHIALNGCMYKYMSKRFLSFTTSHNQIHMVYSKDIYRKENEIDAIIKWDYGSVPITNTNVNVNHAPNSSEWLFLYEY